MNVNDYKKLAANMSNANAGSDGNASEPAHVTDLEAIKSWNNLDSIHSRTSEADEKKSWNNLDSIHSKAMAEHYDESNSSCASFGESSSSDMGRNIQEVSLDNVKQMAELTLQSRQFRSLGDAPNPRAVLMKQQSLRLQRGTSYRGTLSLIDESNSLD